ncbi:hypothetical protein [Flammeovirga aprica]|uniref:Uncharacterized protein n=1 Tax=Flammeovirga aprica JL-4 TaxID=694437 RepID=A0A7X9RQA7_9BACT|nr:hypothetical protein [Flammeovirga aprica]NME66573.1 hypothetical protein [Flammeovirga aprica JL-4]
MRLLFIFLLFISTRNVFSQELKGYSIGSYIANNENIETTVGGVYGILKIFEESKKISFITFSSYEIHTSPYRATTNNKASGLLEPRYSYYSKVSPTQITNFVEGVRRKYNLTLIKKRISDNKVRWQARKNNINYFIIYSKLNQTIDFTIAKISDSESNSKEKTKQRAYSDF